jgi:hypothetical protein
MRANSLPNTNTLYTHLPNERQTLRDFFDPRKDNRLADYIEHLRHVASV